MHRRRLRALALAMASTTFFACDPHKTGTTHHDGGPSDAASGDADTDPMDGGGDPDTDMTDGGSDSATTDTDVTDAGTTDADTTGGDADTVVDAAPDAGTTTAPEVESRGATTLGLNAFTANARVQPHGQPGSTYFEYGATSAYGSRTASKALPPRLSAHYQEAWDGGTHGWAGGFTPAALQYASKGGMSSSSGFVRYSLPGDIDQNHCDGIGVNELIQYMFTGTYEGNGITSVSLGGGDPDFRGAKVSVIVRGNSFVPHDADTQAVFWLQSSPDPQLIDDPVLGRMTNWAFTGKTLTDALVGGGWQKVDYTLENDSNQWTYAGNFVDAQRPLYFYMSIDQALGHLNADIFHMLVFGLPGNEPEGSIDVDDIDITYRNRSVLIESNGGHLVSAPGNADASTLTDGWRNGAGKTWSVASPSGPLEIVYALDNPVLVDAVQLHQDPAHPSKNVEVLVSADGLTYTTLTTGTLPATSPEGPNFAFYLDSKKKRELAIVDNQPVSAWPQVQTRFVKVRILSGYSSSAWGLGEIEVFGSGAKMKTDDDWYAVNQDITGLAPGSTVHYRVVVETDAGKTYGPDTTFEVPATNAPEAITGAATHLDAGTAMLEGRVNPLGISTNTFFQYGPTTAYGEVTPLSYAGVQITRRGAAAKLEGLVPGKTYHYRLAAVNAKGTTYGQDATFIAK